MPPDLPWPLLPPSLSPKRLDLPYTWLRLAACHTLPSSVLRSVEQLIVADYYCSPHVLRLRLMPLPQPLLPILAGDVYRTFVDIVERRFYQSMTIVI
jgi:hypothetical protein